MNNSMILRRSIIAVFLLLIVGGLYLFSDSLLPKQSVVVHQSYAAEAKDPMWSYERSELVVIGEIVGKEKPLKGKDCVYGEDVVYEDTSIKVSSIVKDTLNQDFKEGSKITVRTLGGEVDNFIMDVDTVDLLPTSGKVLLCLIDGKELPGLPLSYDNKVYGIVGGIHGVYELTSDGFANRKVVKDSYKLDDLLNKYQK